MFKQSGSIGGFDQFFCEAIQRIIGKDPLIPGSQGYGIEGSVACFSIVVGIALGIILIANGPTLSTEATDGIIKMLCPLDGSVIAVNLAATDQSAQIVSLKLVRSNYRIITVIIVIVTEAVNQLRQGAFSIIGVFHILPTVIIYSFDQSVKLVVYITYGISVAVGGFGLIAATCTGSVTVDILVFRG